MTMISFELCILYTALFIFSIVSARDFEFGIKLDADSLLPQDKCSLKFIYWDASLIIVHECLLM